MEGGLPGQPMGELWGHLFAMKQVARWLRGLAPPGWSDILFVEGRPFWPVNPLTAGFSAALDLILGGSPPADALAMTLTLLLLLFLTGLGTWVFARAAGASESGAVLGALLVQAHPFLLRNLQDTNLEVASIGLAALTGGALLRSLRRPDLRSRSLLFLAALGMASTAPYWAVYLSLTLLAWILLGALLFAIVRRARPEISRSQLVSTATVLLACSLAALPLYLIESGQHGRLGPTYASSGYHLAPDELGEYEATGRFEALERVPRAPPPRLEVQDHPGDGQIESGRGEPGGARMAPSAPLRLLLRFPGGLTCLALLALALVRRPSRGIAIASLLAYLLGPGPLLVARALDPGSRFDIVPLQVLIQHLPLLGNLGNPQRILMLYVLGVAISGAITIGRSRLLTSFFLILILGEASLTLPGLRLSSTDTDSVTRLLTPLQGPTSFFPLGDPPVWNPGLPPKRTLYLAAAAGVPTTGDYGRGQAPRDLALLLRLSGAAGVPVGLEAASARAGELPSPEQTIRESQEAGIEWLVILRDSLEPSSYARAQEEATTLFGEPSLVNQQGGVWKVQPVSDGRLKDAPPTPGS